MDKTLQKMTDQKDKDKLREKMASKIDLKSAKKKLTEALGDNSSK